MVYQALLLRAGDRDHGRYVLTAPDAETMDEMYAAVWKHKDNEAGLERLAPDFFTWSGPNECIRDHVSSKYVSFTLLPDYSTPGLPPLLNNAPRANLLDGKSFYIRSKTDAQLYWYCAAPKGDFLVISRKGRTRFHIRIESGEEENKKHVMTHSDRVEITKADSSPKLYLAVRSSKLKLIEDEGGRILLGDLKNGRFLGQGEADTEDASFIKVVEHVGEQWELVE